MSRYSSRRGAEGGEQKPRRDIHQEVTNRILAAIEAGTAPWQQEWDVRNQAFGQMPRNAISGRPYHGINLMLLMTTTLERGYTDPRWCTFNQAKDNDWNVKKGERSTLVIFYKPWEVKKNEVNLDTGEEEEVAKKVLLLRHFNVFNAQQIEGIEPLVTLTDNPDWDPHEQAEAVLTDSGADIRYGGDRAFYRPASDFIQLPLREQFHGLGGFYATALHELGHWTGHPSRLDRKFGIKGDPDYAREELRAEIASAMLCAELGLPHKLENHASYVAGYTQRLSTDNREIFRAAADAQKISDFVMKRGLDLEFDAEEAVTEAVTMEGTAESLQPPVEEAARDAPRLRL